MSPFWQATYKQKPSCGSGSGSSISSESGSVSNPDPDKKLKKSTQFFTSFFDQKLHFTYVQATGEAFSPQIIASSSSKNEIY
jgi:hypothetical protein